MPSEQFNQISGTGEVLIGSQSDYHYLFKVLRAQIGEQVILLDGLGNGWYGIIKSFEQKKVEFEITQAFTEMRESSIDIILAQSLIKKDNFELVLQKGTELGVTEFYPMITDRTEIKIDKSEAKVNKKIARWNEIIKNAAQQCRRNILPKVHYPTKLDDLLSNASTMALDFSLLGHENVDTPLQFVLNRSFLKNHRCLLLIGPEGGFSTSEVEKAIEMGITPISLGPRVLRTETAGIISVSLVQYELGDLN